MSTVTHKPGTGRLGIDEQSDRGVLHAVEDNPGAPTGLLAEVLDTTMDSTRSRLVWMMRMGLIERDADGGWKLATPGRRTLRSEPDLERVRKLAVKLNRSPSTGWVANREWRRSR